ncbi:MAG: hypothetical protein JWP97_2082 [Labilithrix sp.]|nr:hypothetical protein [Labilithrix sp.]
MFARSIAVLVAAASLSIACSTTVNGADGSSSGSSGASPSTGGASGPQVDACKEACNKMKFFGCNTADEQAACYSDCGTASAAAIEVFTNCAQTSVCDPACRTNITPKPSNGEAPKGTGASQSSCGTACQKLVDCSLIKLSDNAACQSACASDAYQYQIDCINNTACDSLEKTCGGGGSSGGGSSGGSSGGETTSVGACQVACDQLQAQSCINAADHAGCRAKCSATTTDKRDAFSTCVLQSDCTSNDNDCYKAF